MPFRQNCTAAIDPFLDQFSDGDALIRGGALGLRADLGLEQENCILGGDLVQHIIDFPRDNEFDLNVLRKLSQRRSKESERRVPAS